jgi:hypothetical protein
LSFWSKIFSTASQREWNKILQAPEISSEFKEIIEQFFIPDNIDAHLFALNSKAASMHQSGISYSTLEAIGKFKEFEKTDWTPTPTFKEHYLDYKLSLNRPSGCHIGLCVLIRT